MAQPTRQFTSAIASGSTEAFALFYEQWFDRMYAQARRATRRDESFCLDVVQDSMMKAIRCMKPLDSEAALALWVRRTVSSCAIDALRREARRVRRERGTSRAATDANGDARLREQIEWLNAELAKLDADAAHLLHLRHALGWTLQRIGSMLGLSPGAVDGRLTRIHRQLKAKSEQPHE